MKQITLALRLNTRGFDFKIFNQTNKYKIVYPGKIWSSFPSASKKMLTENFLYARTRPLSLTSKNTLKYQTAKPFLKNMVNWGIKTDLPLLELYNNLPARSLHKKFASSNSKILFCNKNNDGETLSRQNKLNSQKILLALSFGKDSLLSYALLKELGVNYNLCYCQ